MTTECPAHPEVACGACLLGGMHCKIDVPPDAAILWLTHAKSHGLTPSGPKFARLARRNAMTTHWQKDDGSSPPITLSDVLATSSSFPELHFTYIYSN